jgi:hypothetical protein
MPGTPEVTCAISMLHGKPDDKTVSASRGQNTAGIAYTPVPPKPSNFFYSLKKLTLIGYYTSEIGGLRNLVIVSFSFDTTDAHRLLRRRYELGKYHS